MTNATGNISLLHYLWTSLVHSCYSRSLMFLHDAYFNLRPQHTYKQDLPSINTFWRRDFFSYSSARLLLYVHACRKTTFLNAHSFEESCLLARTVLQFYPTDPPHSSVGKAKPQFYSMRHFQRQEPTAKSHRDRPQHEPKLRLNLWDVKKFSCLLQHWHPSGLY